MDEIEGGGFMKIPKVPTSIQQSTMARRCKWIEDTAIQCLIGELASGRLKVTNEASLQMHLGLIVKLLGDKSVRQSERFNIILEKDLIEPTQPFICKVSGKHPNGRTKKNRIDIWFCIEKAKPKRRYARAMELKYFKKDNQREPNNRADVFKDIRNLEECIRLKRANRGFMLVYTDHPHYYNWPRGYRSTTGDFDFRDKAKYQANTPLNYNTNDPHVPQFQLSNSYAFNWKMVSGNFRILGVPIR